MPPRVLLVADSAQEGSLARALRDAGAEVVPAHTAVEAERLAGAGSYDAVVAFTSLFPVEDCEALVRRLRRWGGRRAALLLLTSTGSLESCRGCALLRQERLECVDLPAEPCEVAARLARLLDGDRPQPAPPASPLSPREREVLGLLRLGLSNPEIAARLFITEKVVEKHVSHLCFKLGAANRTEAVAMSYRKALL